VWVLQVQSIEDSFIAKLADQAGMVMTLHVRLFANLRWLVVFFSAPPIARNGS